MAGRIRSEAAMTPVDQVERAQERLMPHEDLSPHAGRWVALREGKVVATDIDAVALRRQPEVESTDVITFVPVARDGAYLL
jgi:hypothetical protein